MKVVVDTNIVFSALLSKDSVIRQIIIDSRRRFFFTSDYMRTELRNHQGKLKKASKLTGEDIIAAQDDLFKYITFIPLEVVSESYWLEANWLVADVDIDDTPFVALALYLDAYLWTGDKILYNGLKAKGYESVLSTQELKYFFDE
jgi:predicted nucleic acid-binding protein